MTTADVAVTEAVAELTVADGDLDVGAGTRASLVGCVTYRVAGCRG